jgi:hypothetical protein
MKHKLQGWGRGVDGMRVLVTQIDRDSVSMLEWERDTESEERAVCEKERQGGLG